ncbi:unnamed protein product [Pseudo-nitzschia multistriata]|uniref:Plastid lipid-associated protein/fibrillin conserved domain-containing protein n=1 Tax=Pseudo-nitzschia multistriata TaxID=183589 RepID=A0A448ZFM7_9STRA|nr:unnamed protein product [Pseudo-nitzschia multistriata]
MARSIWPSFTTYIVTIALLVVEAEAFTTAPECRRITNANKNIFGRVQQLSMVAQMPTSNVTIDDMMLADSVFVDEVNVEDAKYKDEDEEIEDLSTVDTMEIKKRLLDLLPRMKGTPEEYNMVESYVNTLEDRYTPVQTLDFLNLAMSGEWQLLFSTNLGGSMRMNFRLSELFQRIEANSLNGTVVNEATWSLAEDHTDPTPATSFEAFGKFSIKCSYSINQGARMVMELNDHVIELSKGSKVPKDPEKLVGMLYRAIPTELFDPNDHAMDTTYLDGDLRIVRMAGPKFESVRDIFIRRGSIEINPV